MTSEKMPRAASSLPRLDGDDAASICMICEEISPGELCRRCHRDISAFPAEIVAHRFAILREIGSGGGGTVHKAIDIESGAPVALKMTRSDAPWSKEVWAKVRAEVDLLSVVTSEHTVKIYAFGLWGNAIYLAMEFIDGPDMLRIIEEHSSRGELVPLTRAIAILRQIAEGLGAAHAQGIIHDDIKPANIVIEARSGRPVLVDFGLAARQDDLATSDRIIRGTPAYMAPERFLPVPRTPDLAIRSDIYALGCTAFELLSGRVPFEASSFEDMYDRHRHGPRPRLASRRPGLDELSRVVERAMASDPAERFASCEAFVTALLDATPASEPLSRRPILFPEPRNDLPTLDGSAPLRILIVDDDPLFRRVAMRCAQLAFFRCAVQVRSADSGEAALELATRCPPDLLILDYLMPGLNGLEVLTRLRELPGGHACRVLVISGSSLLDEAWRFQVLGVKDFILKPVDFQALTATITALASREGLHRKMPARGPLSLGEDG
jgi:serine/threonine-protein kinase